MQGLKEAFERLNDNKVEYLVLRNWENLPDKADTGAHSDLDLLTSEPGRVIDLLSLQKMQPEEWRVQYKLTFDDGRFTYVDLRRTGDDYYPLEFEKDMLKGRELHEKGFFIPNEDDHFVSLLYHALVHKPSVSRDYKHKLIEKMIGVRIIRPKDASVYYND